MGKRSLELVLVEAEICLGKKRAEGAGRHLSKEVSKQWLRKVWEAVQSVPQGKGMAGEKTRK